MAQKRPAPFPSTAFDELLRSVPRGEFRRYDSREELPSALSRVAGFPSDDEFRTALVTSSSTSANPPSIGGIQPASSAPVFRVSVIRPHRHGQEGEGHFNQYESLIFCDSNGRAWRLYAAHQPGHYQTLSDDSSLSAALDLYHLPTERAEPLSLLPEHGRAVDFSTGGSGPDEYV